MLFLHPADVRSALAAAVAATASYHVAIQPWGGGRRGGRAAYRPVSARADPSPRPLSASLEAASAVKEDRKPAICTADELHYVPVPGTDWRLALWRYTPSPEVPPLPIPLSSLSLSLSRLVS